MPTIQILEKHSKKLKDVYLITGEGLSSNIYVLGRNQATIIDTGIGNDANNIWPQLKQINILPENVKKIVLTHAHHDHSMGLFRIISEIKPKIYIHQNALRNIHTDMGENIVQIEDGYIIKTEIFSLRVLWTPGHTDGGVCLFQDEEGILFSGDTVFPDGNFGRYDLSTGSLPKIIQSLKKLLELNVEIMFPGHGHYILHNAKTHIKRSYRNAVMLYKST